MSVKLAAGKTQDFQRLWEINNGDKMLRDQAHKDGVMKILEKCARTPTPRNIIKAEKFFELGFATGTLTDSLFDYRPETLNSMKEALLKKGHKITASTLTHGLQAGIEFYRVGQAAQRAGSDYDALSPEAQKLMIGDYIYNGRELPPGFLKDPSRYTMTINEFLKHYFQAKYPEYGKLREQYYEEKAPGRRQALLKQMEELAFKQMGGTNPITYPTRKIMREAIDHAFGRNDVKSVIQTFGAAGLLDKDSPHYDPVYSKLRWLVSEKNTFQWDDELALSAVQWLSETAGKKVRNLFERDFSQNHLPASILNYLSRNRAKLEEKAPWLRELQLGRPKSYWAGKAE